MKMLITGVSGLLGGNLAWELKKEHSVVGTYKENPVEIAGVEVCPLDVTAEREVEKAVGRLRPEVVIHSAALTNVDLCERDKKLAYQVNVAATRYVARATERIGGRLIYISTDSVYDGVEGDFSETASPGPVNEYARSKLWGEMEARNHCRRHLILRTNFYGWNLQDKLSLAEWILDKARQGQDQVPGFDDIFFSPLLANDIARIIKTLIEREAFGVYNAGARDSCSKYEFARLVCEVFGLGTERVRKTTSDEVDFAAVRPKNTSLDVVKLIGEVGEELVPTVREGVDRFKELEDKKF